VVHFLSLHEAVQRSTVFVLVGLFNYVAPNVNFLSTARKETHIRSWMKNNYKFRKIYPLLISRLCKQECRVSNYCR